MTQYEQLIEYIINEQEDKARELFHQIVVEKSREIYENLIDETDLVDEVKSEEQVEDLVNDIEVDKEGLPEAEDDAMGGETDDVDMEMDMDDEEGEEGEEAGEEELEDRVMDLEAALDELKAEFDKLMADEQDEPEHADMFGKEEVAMEDDETLREYVEQVGGNDYTKFGKSGDNGANAKSVVASKNDMGGKAFHLGKDAEASPDGKATPHPSNQYAKGKGNLPGAGSFENVPGAKTKGYTNKAGAPAAEGSTTDGKMGVDTKSLVGGKVR